LHWSRVLTFVEVSISEMVHSIKTRISKLVDIYQ